MYKLREQSIPMPGVELRLLCPPARSLITFPTELIYPWKFIFTPRMVGTENLQVWNVLSRSL
jgi:hypothetical protein